MKFEEYREKLKRIEKLIADSNTGSPKDLAKKLNVSERTIRRLIERLRLQNHSIVFCRNQNSYVFKK